jgi:hypothetical protein
MVNVPPVMSSTVIWPSRALVLIFYISFNTSKSQISALRTTGTINPFGPDTAIEISQNRKQSYDHHPSYYLHLGIIATLCYSFCKERHVS